MTRHFLLILLAITCSHLRAQVDEEAQEFSLEEAEKYALENSYSVQDARLNFLKAKQTINETRAMGLPHITGSFAYQWNPQIAKQPVPAEFFGGEKGTFQTIAFGVEHNNNATLQLNQLVLDASYFVALRASKLVKDNQRLEAESTEIDVANDVAEAYYGVLVSEKLVDIIEENLTSLKKNLFEVRKLYENGFTEEQDVDQLELLVNNLNNNLSAAQRQQELARMLLNFNMGRPVDKALVLSTTLDDLVVSSEEAVRNIPFSYENHIDYRSMLVQERGAQLQVTYDKMAWLPTLSGFVRHQQSNFSNDFEDAFSFNVFWIPSTTLGLSLNWTLLDGLARPAKIQKAKLDLDRLQVAKELTGNQLKLQYNQALTNYVNALESYKNAERNVDISKKIRDKTRIKYSEGISSSLELTQAENQYLDTQRGYIQALQNLLIAREELDKALGVK